MNPTAALICVVLAGWVTCAASFAREPKSDADADGKKTEQAGAGDAKAVSGEHPAHQELRGLRDRLLAAVNKADYDAVLTWCHPDIRFSTPDGRVHRGHDGVRKYFDEMTKGPNAYVKSFKSQVEVDDLTVLYGDDTGVATGTSTDEFEVAGGKKFTLHDRWSATVVKDGDKWLIASYHTAPDVFDNPILEQVKQFVYWGAGIGVAVGVIAGFIAARFIRRSAPKAA